MNTLVRAARGAASSSRSVRPCRVPLATSSRHFSSSSSAFDTAPAPQPAASPASPKIGPIVDTISSLSLLEVSELVTALKTRLNITEISIPSSSSAPTAAAPSASDDVPAEEKPKEKTIFTVKLEKFETAAKAKIIREVKAMMPNMNLVEAKKFVESVPQVLKESLPKEEAEKLQKQLTDLGATVSLS